MSTFSRAANRRGVKRLEQRRLVTRVYNVGTRLGTSEARRRARVIDKRAGYGDHRGFTYDPQTGRATLT